MEPDGAKRFYDLQSADYDRMVNWSERLKREEPFFRKMFSMHGVNRVLDLACGTGMHVIAFRKWGYEAEGADVSPEMIEKARANAVRAGVNASFQVAAFGAVSGRYPGTFDAVTCLGNSLPHILDGPSLREAFLDARKLLKHGGILVIQNRNYDRILRERERFMPVNNHGSGDGEVIFIRMVDFVGEERVDFTILTLRKVNARWVFTARTTPLRALRKDTVETALRETGFERIEVFGSYEFTEYGAPGTSDLLAIAVS